MVSFSEIQEIVYGAYDERVVCNEKTNVASLRGTQWLKISYIQI